METMTMTLTDFLLARIAEDEATARAASPGGWTYPGVESVAGGTLYDETRRIIDVVYEQPSDHDGRIVRHLLVDEADANGQHIARHDPARVLAECEAKRRIVERCAADYDEACTFGRCSCTGMADAQHHWLAKAACWTLLDLAAVYADHLDYRDEWRP